MSYPSRSSITELLTNEQYSADSIEQLEQMVAAQVAGAEPYFRDCNKHLLKMYQIFPSSPNLVKFSAVVLLLATYEYPGDDFTSFIYAVSEKTQGEEACSAVIKCASLLQACDFEAFWKEFQTLLESTDISEVKESAKLGESKLRAGILEALSQSYKTIAVNKALPLLNLTGPEWLQSNPCASVEAVDTDKITFISTASNTKRNRVFQEGLTFSFVASTMAKVASE